MLRRALALAIVITGAMGTVARAQQGFMPASFQSGAVPQLKERTKHIATRGLESIGRY